VTQGATTIWERWDGIKPDGRLDPDALRMNSFNHYALGAVGDWLHRRVGGLALDGPGWRHLRIAPAISRVDGAPTWATSRLDTPYGPAESSWRLDGNTFELTAVVPPNTTADVVFPGIDDGPLPDVGSGTHRWTYELDDGPAGDGEHPVTAQVVVDDLVDLVDLGAGARPGPGVRR
jgi:alpha-L-rhamnosidase